MGELSARDLFGDLFPAQRPIPNGEELRDNFKIDIYKVRPAATPQGKSERELVDTLDTEINKQTLADLHGAGRFLLIAKRISDGKVITQTLQNISPSEVTKAPSEDDDSDDGEVEPQQDDMLEAVADKVVEKLKRAGIFQPPQPQVPVRDSRDEMMSLMKDLLIQKNQAQSPDQIAKAVSAAVDSVMAINQKLLMGKMDLEQKRQQRDLDFVHERRMRLLDREDAQWEARQRMMLQELRSVKGESEIDPDGAGPETLLEAVKEIFGGKDAQILGFPIDTVIDFLAPGLPALTKALEDKGVYIMSEDQIKFLQTAHYKAGIQAAQKKFLESQQAVIKTRQGAQRSKPVPTPQPKEAGIENETTGGTDLGDASAAG